MLQKTYLCLNHLLATKCSMLNDAAQGLAYLHSQVPPINHRSLKASQKKQTLGGKWSSLLCNRPQVGSSKGPKPVVMRWSPIIEHISKRNSSLLCHNCSTINAPPIVSPIPISPLCLTSHFMSVQNFHTVNIWICQLVLVELGNEASVGAPPLDTQLAAQTVHTNQYEARFYVVCV